MDQKILNLHQEYQTGRMARRVFIKRLTQLAGGTAAALTMLPFLDSSFSRGEIISAADPRLISENINYPAENGPVQAYLSRPKGDQKLPGVIVIHENKGLQPHIKDVARRVALEGFLALAPDALSPLGGTPENVDEARTKMRQLDSAATIDNYVAAVDYLKTHPQTTGKVGCMGFCWGGGMTNQVAVNSADLIAGVPFYGRQPAVDDVPKIKASLLLHYAGNDERINAGIPAFEEALKKSSVDYKIFVYAGASHAFYNDANASRYNEEAAQLAFKRTIAFFKEKLLM